MRKVIIGNLWWVIPLILVYIAQKTNMLNDIHGVKPRSIEYLIIAIAFFQAGFYNLSQFKIGVRKGLNIGWMIILFGGGGINIIIILLGIIEEFSNY